MCRSSRIETKSCRILYKVLLYVYTKQPKCIGLAVLKQNLVPFCTRFCHMCTQKSVEMSQYGRIKAKTLYNFVQGFALCIHKYAKCSTFDERRAGYRNRFGTSSASESIRCPPESVLCLNGISSVPLSRVLS